MAEENKSKAEEKVELSKTQLEELMASHQKLLEKIEALESNQVDFKDGKPIYKVGKNVIKVGTYKEKLLIGWSEKGAYLVYNDKSNPREIIMIDILLEDEKTFKPFNYREFFYNMELHEVEVVEVKKKKLESSNGKKEKLDVVGTKVVVSDYVDDIITFEEVKFVIRHPLTSKEIEIDAKVANPIKLTSLN